MTKLTHKPIALVGTILIMLIGTIVPQHVSLARTPTPDLSQVSAKDIRLANVRPWHNPPLWSPDGKWMAWSSFTEGLYIQKVGSSTERKQLGMARVPRHELAWSWDSTVLFYQVNQPIADPPFIKRWIESVDVETGTGTEHPELSIYDNLDSVARARDPKDPILSLNFKNNLIEARTKDGTRHWRVTPNPVHHLSAILSSDGKKVLAYGYVYATDGSGLLAYLGNGSFGSWSSDSTKIVYAIIEDDGHAITASDLYIINADGTGKKQLTNTPDRLERDPRWSPDGASVVFYADSLYADSTSAYIADIVVGTE